MKISFENIDDKDIQSALGGVGRSVFTKAERLISFDRDIEIRFKKAENPEALAELDGVGGFCNSGDLITIGIDTEKYGEENFYPIERTLAHELFHASEIKRGVDVAEGTLRDFLINEGLADHFSEKITGKVPEWAEALDEKDIKRLWKIVEPKLYEKVDDKIYEEWFTKGSNNIPKWAGYSLGYWLSSNNSKD